jgi:hypothetical protein
MGKFQHYSTTPLLHYSIRMRLTALRTVSCYRVSAGPNRAAGRVLRKGFTQAGERASFGLESAANK